MKVLYAIQGTGNGHMSRAEDIIPILKQRVDLDILVSGIQADIKLSHPVTYQCKGMSFIFGKKGGIDVWQTVKHTNIAQLFNEIYHLPIKEYDLILSDFEPVSAWAAQLKGVKCFSISHQSAVIHPNSPRPSTTDWLGEFILKYYAPSTKQYGFHFESYAESVYYPIIRKSIRQLSTNNQGHYTVYLPAYGDNEIISILSKVKNTNWHVFSKHTSKIRQVQNVKITPVDKEGFLDSFSSCEGILCGAGFETPAEALYLQKKLMVIPMKGQYEQQCNAAALKQLGVPVIKSLKSKYLPQIKEWTENEDIVEVFYPDETAQIIDNILFEHGSPKLILNQT